MFFPGAFRIRAMHISSPSLLNRPAVAVNVPAATGGATQVHGTRCNCDRGSDLGPANRVLAEVGVHRGGPDVR